MGVLGELGGWKLIVFGDIVLCCDSEYEFYVVVLFNVFYWVVDIGWVIICLFILGWVFEDFLVMVVVVE